MDKMVVADFGRTGYSSNSAKKSMFDTGGSSLFGQNEVETSKLAQGLQQVKRIGAMEEIKDET